MKKLFSALVIAGITCSCSSKRAPVTHEEFVTGTAMATTYAIETPHSQCPEGTAEVEGDYCPEVEEVCLRWSDGHGGSIDNPKRDQTSSDWNVSNKCLEFKSPTRCLSTHLKHKHYCIDKYEYPNVEGQVPQSWMTWHDVKDACESQGKRLCTESEWTFACEGVLIQPYPYGDGYHRDSTSCNTDNHAPKGLDVFKATSHGTPTAQELDKMLMPSGAMSECVSPWGVHDMPGNIDEFVLNESGHPYKSGLVGGHVFGVRNNCRAATDGHNEQFSWYETGGRCCANPQQEH